MDVKQLRRSTVKALRTLAGEHAIKGRSTMRKAELVDALLRVLRQPVDPQPVPPELVDVSSASSPRGGGAQPPERRDGEPDPGLPIPDRYARDRLVLLPQDPHHLFAYWELSGPALHGARQRASADAQAVLLLHGPDGSEQREIDLDGGSYYLSVAPASSYRAELALRTSTGELIGIVASEPIDTPPLGPSDQLDQEWMVVDETFDELLVRAGLPGGPSSADLIAEQRLQARLYQQTGVAPLSSGALPGSHSMPSSHPSGSSGSRRG